MAQTKTDVCNMALAHLGDAPTFMTDVTADTSKPAIFFRTIIDAALKAVLREFPWNFAMKRDLLELSETITNAADNGSGLIRITQASHGYSTGNFVGISEITGTTEANGEWVVTVINASTYDLDDSDFINAYVSGGRSSIAPDFGFRHRHALPSDFIRKIKLGTPSVDNIQDYQIEDGYILTDHTVLELQYVYAVEDYAKMDPLFYECLSLKLAEMACYAITESNSREESLQKRYARKMAKARLVDSADNPQKRFNSTEWLDARMSAGRGRFVRDPMT